MHCSTRGELPSGRVPHTVPYQATHATMHIWEGEGEGKEIY